MIKKEKIFSVIRVTSCSIDLLPNKTKNIIFLIKKKLKTILKLKDLSYI